MSKIADVCIFTIVSNNYLHYANTLFDSVKEHFPEADMFLGLCDEITEATACACDGIIEIKDLNIPSIGQFIYQYTILELNTAMKPYLISLLMDRGYSKVIYFDPDIKIFGPLTEMLSYLDNYNILLTPHLTNTICDDKSPGELQILQAGSYNLGYIGLSASEETRKLVAWWQEKLFKDCVVDLPRGLFVDQKWMDLVPSMFDGVKIVRDNGWNTAYWNLSHRTVTKTQDNTFFVNGVPLIFFHYSGYSIEAKTLSKHQNRHTKASEGPAVEELCEIYNSCLKENGIDNFSTLPYAFSEFADGTRIPDAARGIIRAAGKELDSIDFFDPRDIENVHRLLNSPAKGTNSSPVLITRLLQALWLNRADLQNAFPDYESTNSVGLVKWAIANAEREAGFSDRYLGEMRRSLANYHGGKSEYELESRSFGPFRYLVRYIWDHRERIPLSWRLRLGEDLATWASSHSYPGTTKSDAANDIKHGVNLVGYMHAESGIGEAARSTYRALQETDLPFCVIDYRVGNVSRMNANIDCDMSDEFEYNTNIFQVNADQTGVVIDHFGERVQGKYNIGFWYWELPELPSKFDFAFEHLDEIWVASEFVKAAICGRTSKPVTIIPPSISVTIESELSRKELGLPQEGYLFFCMSDALSVGLRKNPVGSIKAFKMAFPTDSNFKAFLVLKISNLSKDDALVSAVKAEIASDPRIILLDSYLDRDYLINIISVTDCYVSLHRSEGFGLPLAEAMALGKPVIATNWSGNVDFMTKENSFLVNYKLTELLADIGPYEAGQVWAEPDLEDAAEKMRLVASDTQLAAKIGLNAKSAISSGFSAKYAATKIHNRFHEIFRLSLNQEN